MPTFLYNPLNGDDLIRFYFFWITFLLLLHVASDFFSSKTPKLLLSDLQGKVSEMYSAATVSSSVLLGMILLNGFEEHPIFSTDAVYAPLVNATLSSMMVGLSGLSLKRTQA